MGCASSAAAATRPGRSSRDDCSVEDYVSHLATLDRVLGDYQCGRLNKEDAVWYADDCLRKIAGLGHVDVQRAQALLEQRGYDIHARKHMERAYEDMKFSTDQGRHRSIGCQKEQDVSYQQQHSGLESKCNVGQSKCTDRQGVGTGWYSQREEFEEKQKAHALEGTGIVFGSANGQTNRDQGIAAGPVIGLGEARQGWIPEGAGPDRELRSPSVGRCGPCDENKAMRDQQQDSETRQQTSGTRSAGRHKHSECTANALKELDDLKSELAKARVQRDAAHEEAAQIRLQAVSEARAIVADARFSAYDIKAGSKAHADAVHADVLRMKDVDLRMVEDLKASAETSTWETTDTIAQPLRRKQSREACTDDCVTDVPRRTGRPAL